jgi:hypothetical protein
MIVVKMLSFISDSYTSPTLSSPLPFHISPGSDSFLLCLGSYPLHTPPPRTPAVTAAPALTVQRGSLQVLSAFSMCCHALSCFNQGGQTLKRPGPAPLRCVVKDVNWCDNNNNKNSMTNCGRQLNKCLSNRAANTSQAYLILDSLYHIHSLRKCQFSLTISLVRRENFIFSERLKDLPKIAVLDKGRAWP